MSYLFFIRKISLTCTEYNSIVHNRILSNINNLFDEKEKKMNQNNLEQRRRISESFRMMWDNFPQPVLLLQKSRKIIDANQAARNLGVFSGVQCRDISPYPEKCKNNCLADKALVSGTTERTVNRQGDKISATYWIPLTSVEDGLYLHFVIDLPAAMIQ